MILRTSRICLLGLWLLTLLTLLQAQGEDYGGDVGDGNLGDSDDIYEPAQQEAELETETQQRRNSIEAEESALPAQTVNELQSMEQPSTTDKVPASVTEMSVPTAASATTEYDENTAAEVMEDAPTQKQETKVEKPARHSQEYYYEDMQDEEQHAEQQPKKQHKEPQEEATTATTTTVPEYVRKAKAERFPQTEPDYAEDDMMVEQQTQPINTPKDQAEGVIYRDEPAQPQAHMQQLPVSHKAKPFNPSSVEYYYDELDSTEHRITTTVQSTPTTTITTKTTEAPLPVLAARFGGFAGFGGWPEPIPSAVPTNAPPVAIPSSTTTTTTTTTTPTPTTSAPRKQSKHIHLAKPELLPADQLRNYIKDVYIRMPLAVIVDPSAASLDQTKRLYIDALQDKNINIKIVLVTLNASGVPSAFSFNNTREFIAGLNSTKEFEGGNAFVGVLQAAELVPYDSAIFISTAAVPPHTDIVQDAAITLLKKRIRLFMLWYGERSANENETEDAVGGILGEVAIRSGGEIIHIVSTEHGQHIAGNTLTLVSDAYQGSQELELPVDTTLSSLHVRIDANMRRATLATPNGDINLKKHVKFKSSNDTRNTNPDELDAYVPLNKLRKATILKLQLTPESPSAAYNVFIRAERKADVFLGEIIKRIDSYYSHAVHESPLASLARSAKLKFPETREKLENEVDSPKSEVETFSETELVQPPTNLNQTQFAAATGEPQRASLNAMLLQRCGTKIELNTQSQLLLNAGQVATLLFEVTNMRAERVYQTVQVTDERRFLVQLSPTGFYLRARETGTVRLTVLAPTGTSPGTTDRVTFTSYGTETATLAVSLKVVSSIDAQDTTGPNLSWEFGNRCDYVKSDEQNCGDRFWTLDVTAQDWQSGILRLQSTPADGLFYRNYYTAGTTEPMKATYMASCCEPKVALTAFDAAGNQRSINIDVRDIVLTEAAIAAICLGAILLLLLIVLLIWSIMWCCKRRKVSLELPTYRSHSTRSME
ncbi:PREDICTED: uncharacterized protein LOC108610653 [Drosophila arizonae]|uniref:Uncharacterized protein LOC108610653 n=1 Tax=Drosophila arizonae TaxID=7263 RepID=A0ABM1NTR9_DROAR|nr:PREDICTED: uncharacterized protein LOC108610653 [Drosophila arizonae]XP_017858354.1 PREDICTED: uncharacterized protein LOC108610653 [Drosophila arizonae]XP_017858355.1 PREDICTED: uncharacterized protein LOC108610653 [Drosophila arizonae]XP_017858356.1 PREDICTED: uncharacterized protein LOC108610653 [Drosophila arizonae]